MHCSYSGWDLGVEREGRGKISPPDCGLSSFYPRASQLFSPCLHVSVSMCMTEMLTGPGSMLGDSGWRCICLGGHDINVYVCPFGQLPSMIPQVPVHRLCPGGQGWWLFKSFLTCSDGTQAASENVCVWLLGSQHSSWMPS